MGIADELVRLAERNLSYIIALGLAYARIQGVLQLFPLFTTINLRGFVRTSFALVLAIPVVPMIEREVAALASPSVLTLVLIGMKEVGVGLLIGVLVALPFWGVQAAGDIIDFERSASAANLADPVNANENSLTGVILLYVSLALFIVVGGLQAVVSIVYESYELIRVTALLPEPRIEVAKTLGGLLAKLFTLGILIAGPVMVALAVIDLSLVFAARIARQIPVYDFLIILKNLCVAAFIPLYSLFLQHYVLDDWRLLLAFIRNFLRAGIAN